MGMVVRTNTMAMNANRQLSMNNSQVAKSLEKLSSGFRINRAADDASGLAISEKMKAQIKGLEQASANSQDGISLIQTAEGGLTEVHNMLNRMVELATKSANGTIRDDVDREAIQTEVDALNTEITRISKATNFNGINLLDGSLGSSKNIVVTNATIGGTAATISTVPPAASSYTTGTVAAGTAAQATLTVKYTDENGKAQSVDIAYTGTGTAATNAKAIADALKGDSKISSLFDVTGGSGTDAIVLKSKTTGANSAVVTGMSTTDTAAGAATVAGGTSVAGANAYNTFDTNGLAVGDKFTINGKTYEFVAAAGDEAVTKNATAIVFNADFATGLADINAALKKDGIIAAQVGGGTEYSFKADPAATGKGLTLQIGDTNDDFNKVTVSVGDMSAAGIGTEGINVSNQDSAGDAIDVIKSAINTVSTNRANLGALQNRLEYTINNLDTTAENMNAANSRIRDTDMAKEMMNYTKMNILTQAAQAMLAQANQQPQAILQLLQ